MYEVLVLALTVAVLVIGAGIVVGTVGAFMAVGICFMILQGYVTWPFLETRLLIPMIHKLLLQHPEHPVYPRVTRYLDSARARGLIPAGRAE